MTDRLDGLRRYAHRLSLQLMAIAGVTTGLLLGIGFLFLGQSLRAAVAVWALMVSVGAVLALLGQHVRRQADDLHAVGGELRSQQVEVLRRTAEATNALGDVRARLSRLERRLGELEDERPEATADPTEAPPVPSGSLATDGDG